ncbi:hypothetical protein [Enterobacter hormaechei]|uniref:hypothetical protein n=1 Tax=Enterobacter hormaechei TaxID=158836 RepID=UPI0023E41219|nr:hypothetical protein [Enterobacter hormaechei]MDF3686250.1 hypothetical protein [Enterobacter hormaechei]
MILTPIYLLSMLRRMFYGYKVFNVPNPYFKDSGPRELFILIDLKEKDKSDDKIEFSQSSNQSKEVRPEKEIEKLDEPKQV